MLPNITILFLALFLRTWKLNETMPFIGDFGWYYLQAKDVLTQGNIPLVGIPSSVPILHQGVLWTYLLAGALFLGKFHPLSGGIISALFGVLGVMLTYFVGSEIFNKRIASIAALLAATFPFIVFHDRIPFQTAVIFPASLVFAYLLNKTYIELSTKYMFLTGLAWGILFQLELAAIILIPVILVVYLIKPVKIGLKTALDFVGGAFWGTFTFFLYDFKNGVFIQTLGFVAWFSQKLYENYYLIFGLVLIFVFRKLFLKLKQIEFTRLLILTWAAIGSLAILARGVYSEAYFPLIYFPYLFISGTILDYLIMNYKYLGLFLLMGAIVGNTFVVLKQIKKIEESGSGLANQIKAVNYIIDDAGGKNTNFYNFGPGLQFHTSGNEWEYLFWWKGKEYSKQQGANYAIIEYPFTEIKGYSVVKEFGSYKVAVKHD